MPSGTTKAKRLLRVGPRGFCAGVVRAVDIVELALQAYGPPVYVHHEIVHNRYVVDQLRGRGAIFVESVGAVPVGAVLIFSAHGVPPTVREEAQDRQLRVIDATCPLVTKVHLEALRFAREGRTIILIGHKACAVRFLGDIGGGISRLTAGRRDLRDDAPNLGLGPRCD